MKFSLMVSAEFDTERLADIRTNVNISSSEQNVTWQSTVS